MARWSVRIEFTDGLYVNQVIAHSDDRAIELAMMDARMASPYGSFYGRVVGWEVNRNE